MAQRNSGYERIPFNFYPTPAWVTDALVKHVLGENSTEHYRVWEPAAGEGAMVDALKSWGFKTWGTDIRHTPSVDFLSEEAKAPRRGINSIITNPPYGRDVCDPFVRKSIDMMREVGGFVAMLLRIDYDSAVTRGDMFADCDGWGTKLVLTKRIKWFDDGNKNGPSENHAWYCWDFSKAAQNVRRMAGARIIYGQ